MITPNRALIAFVLAVAMVPLFAAQFTVTLVNYIGLSALVALGLVLLTGVGGLTSFGQAAFVGLGAYTTEPHHRAGLVLSDVCAVRKRTIHPGKRNQHP